MAKGKKTGGRKAGVPNKRNAEVRAAGDQANAQLREPFNGDGYALLALVYNDTKQPLALRMSAAAEEMPYERPRLSQVAMTTRSLDSMSDEEFFKYGAIAAPTDTPPPPSANWNAAYPQRDQRQQARRPPN